MTTVVVMAAQARAATWSKAGRRANWCEGKAPFNIGRPPEAYDKDGLFAEEIKLKEDWDGYLEQHAVGTTERKWDKLMRKEVIDRVSKLLERTLARTQLSVAISTMDEQDVQAKTRIKSLKEARAVYARGGPVIPAHLPSGSAIPDTVQMEDLAQLLVANPEVQQQDTDNWCDALKNVTRRVLLEKAIESRKAERKQKVAEFKGLSADVKVIKDDILYLVAKMREAAHEYARTTADTQSLDINDDDEYDLPDVKTSVLVGLPSNNRLRRTDTVAAAPVDVGDTASSDSFDSTQPSTEKRPSADEEEPAAKRVHTETNPSPSTASSFRSWGFGT